jgi:hypothetical protein
MRPARATCGLLGDDWLTRMNESAFNGRPRELRWNIRDYIVERKKFFHGRETAGRLIALTIIARRHSSTPGERVMRGLL